MELSTHGLDQLWSEEMQNLADSRKVTEKKIASVLCVCSDKAAVSIVSACTFVASFHHVESASDAIRILRHESYTVLIIATEDQELLKYCTERGAGVKFNLLRTAIKYSISMARIVFSGTVHANLSLFRACIECGADGVVSTVLDLETSVRGLLIPEEALLTSEQISGLVCKGVMSRRWTREDQLRRIAGGHTTFRLQQTHNWTARLQQQLKLLGNTLHTTNQMPKAIMRVVHVSDTHNLHRQLNIPPGDLFLHSGDICANYSNQTDLVEHFCDFLTWIQTDVAPNFKKVVFIAGNHDTYLDPKHANNNKESFQRAKSILQEFLRGNKSVCYLHDTATRFRGLTIYGSPTCICRAEALGKRYLSNGFECSRQERQSLWRQIPSDTNILLTHVPPSGLGYEKQGATCPYLRGELYENADFKLARKHLLLHVFGHVHPAFGIQEIHLETSFRSTLLLNGCQERILRADAFCGGTSLVVNIPTETESAIKSPLFAVPDKSGIDC
jgi:hypothetical protein